MYALSPLLLTLLLPLATPTTPPNSEYLFTNPPSTTPHAHKIPSRHDSAILARRILKLSSIATLSTVYPSSRSYHGLSAASPSLEQQDPLHPDSNYVPSHLDVGGAPVGLMDYYASCAPQAHNPTILAISIATSFRNARAGSNVSMSLRWTPPASAPPSPDPYAYSAANMPRFSLEGYIERIPEDEVEEEGVAGCFFERHQDAVAWKPGSEVHESWWGRLRVEGVYWIGGFGDRAYIGWIPREEWEDVTEMEVKKARLVGEEGYEAPDLGKFDGGEL